MSNRKAPVIPATEREWLTTDEVAAHFGVTVSAIRKWRFEGSGPQGTRLGRHVRYHRDDVEAWAEERRKKSRAS